MKWTIIYYYHDKPIHLDILYKSNPEAQIIPLYLKHNLPRYEVWKNSDRILRNLILENDIINQILHENIILLEYDVYMNRKIPDMDFSSIMTLYSTLNATHWYWWHETEKLFSPYKEYAIAGPLFCVIAIKKGVLEKILDKQHNEIFNMDIMSELRFPTVIRSMGYEPSAFPKYFSEYITNTVDNVDTMQHFVQNNHTTIQGIFHPVKNKIC